MYKVTRLFVGGLLDGLTYVGYQDWPICVGVEIDGFGGQRYRIVECVWVNV